MFKTGPNHARETAAGKDPSFRHTLDTAEYPFERTPLAQAQGSGILNDNFGEDGALNPSYWTTSSAFLTALAAAASSPAGSFVAPELAFHPSGMKMTAPTQDYEMTGIQSIDTFGAPLNTQISVTPTAGRDDSFEIFLASPDLTQFLTVSGNVGSANKGIWATAPNISELSQLGEQFSPPIETAFNTDYKILIDIDAQGAATVTVKNINAVLGTLSNLQAGVGPFYLVLGQRTGLARTGPQVRNGIPLEWTERSSAGRGGGADDRFMSSASLSTRCSMFTIAISRNWGAGLKPRAG